MLPSHSAFVMRSWLQAARDGDVEALQLLASCGANADAPDYNGRTALHMAAAEGRKLSIYCLLSRYYSNPHAESCHEFVHPCTCACVHSKADVSVRQKHSVSTTGAMRRWAPATGGAAQPLVTPCAAIMWTARACSASLMTWARCQMPSLKR